MLQSPLSLRPPYRIKKPAKQDNGSLVGKLNNTNELRERLMREMLDLEKQCQSLDPGSENVDFSRVQACKEMIQNRRALLEQLNRSCG